MQILVQRVETFKTPIRVKQIYTPVSLDDIEPTLVYRDGEYGYVDKNNNNRLISIDTVKKLEEQEGYFRDDDFSDEMPIIRDELGD